MSNGIYEVIYERSENNTIIDEIHYIEADSIVVVMEDSVKHAESYRKKLRSVRYLFNVSKRLTSE